MTLKEACAVVFQDAITPVTLKAEAARGNLVIRKIGRAYFVTWRDLNAMWEKCRLPKRPSDSKGSSVDNQTEEARHRASHAAALALAEHLRKKRRKT